MAQEFRDFLYEVEKIRLKEPLAEMLGAFASKDAVLEYSFIDTIKMAGHACPTVSGAYLCCLKALEKLYPGGIPTRGEITVTVYGEADDGVYGVMAQVFSFLTGAAAQTGFKGLGYKFRRKDLLKYEAQKGEKTEMRFQFRRLDNNKSVLVRFYPHSVPVDPNKGERMSELMERVLWDAAKEPEIAEFQQLWMEKVHTMLIERKDIDQWLKVEEGS